MHRALGVILVCQGVAEVDQEPVAQVFGDVAIEARDDLRARFLVSLDHLAKVFGVELGR